MAVSPTPRISAPLAIQNRFITADKFTIRRFCVVKLDQQYCSP
jgi:hypothetical protein